MPESPPFCEAFGKLAQVAIALGAAPLTKHAGLWRHDLPGGWSVEVNGHDGAVEDLKPYHARLKFNGWPAGIINPYGGIIAAGEAANEDTFIAALDAELARLKSEASA